MNERSTRIPGGSWHRETESAVNRTTHPLVEVLETPDWIMLDCAMCAGQLVRVWHATGRLERFDAPSIDHQVAHWWVRSGGVQA